MLNPFYEKLYTINITEILNNLSYSFIKFPVFKIVLDIQSL